MSEIQRAVDAAWDVIKDHTADGDYRREGLAMMLEIRAEAVDAPLPTEYAYDSVMFANQLDALAEGLPYGKNKVRQQPESEKSCTNGPGISPAPQMGDDEVEEKRREAKIDGDDAKQDEREQLHEARRVRDEQAKELAEEAEEEAQTEAEEAQAEHDKYQAIEEGAHEEQLDAEEAAREEHDSGGPV